MVGFLGTLDDCVICPPGTFCPVGTNAPTPCGAGTFNDQPMQEACTKCAPGSFQDVEGATACKNCTDGYYCAEGAAAAPSGSVADMLLCTW